MNENNNNQVEQSAETSNKILEKRLKEKERVRKIRFHYNDNQNNLVKNKL